MAQKVRTLFNRVFGIRLRYRMLLVYIIGGALPILLIGLYLVHGIYNILTEQAKSAEVTELDMTKRQVEEMANTLVTVTKYFYFDPQLEEISAKEYTDYQEMVQDYRKYDSFLNYGSYYNNTIAWMNIYLTNDTIVSNSRFTRVTEETEKEEWYGLAREKNGGAIWRFCQIPSNDHHALTLLRMLKTRRGGDVGVLAVYVRPDRFETFLQGRDCDTFVVLNGETVVADAKRGLSFEQAAGSLPEMGAGQVQKNVVIDGQEYVMTCENLPLVESEDYLQIISFRAYRDILYRVTGQIAKSALFFALSAVISITVILLFSHSFSSRVERFRAEMQKAAEGNFALEKKLGGSDEISELYDHLGTMIYHIQRLLAEVYRERLHAERLTIQQKDAEFKMLASQINPHFLYNTLETIRMKARRSRQRDIEEIVQMLAKIMRSTLQAGVSEVTIRNELELVENYLKIQQYRFEERIQYHIFVEEGLADLPILPLIMEPIVENSIIHGLESKEGIGNIDIRVCRRKEYVVISIEDDGLGMDSETLERLRKNLNVYNKKGKHIGVSNVHQRVKLKYGEACGVEISSAEGKGTKAEILLPAEAELRGGVYVQSDDN